MKYEMENVRNLSNFDPESKTINRSEIENILVGVDWDDMNQHEI
jgi:hypothetical protein